MENIARENFKIWNDALQTKNPELVASLYSEEATFLPTLSDKFKKGQAEAKEYFEHFLQKNPFGTVLSEEVQSSAQNPNLYIHSGLYDFQVGAQNDRQIVNARFTFVWEKQKDGIWKIIHHHSSLLPK